MTMIVKCIAHTEFHGVPSDLLPEADLRKELGGLANDLNPNMIDSIGRDRLHKACSQDHGTTAERLIECAGRACYDSYGKGRDSDAYHKHIMEVNHGSVTEHASLSFFIGGVSRGLTHELVRHRVGVAISQRSTRYVDENESPWAWHPLLVEFAKEMPEVYPMPETTQIEHDAVSIYLGNRLVEQQAQDQDRKVVDALQAWLISKGADKFTARKQARGAARGLLGNALTTELVWTANCRALKTVLDQRAKGAADAEIRLLANRLYEEALPYWPTYLGCYHKRPCPDGIGYELFVPDPKDAEIAALKAKLEILTEISGIKINEATKS